jgi:hypothetical protein
MADFLAWVKSDWLSIVQTVGVVGGLFYTGITCRQVAKAKQTENLLAFTERHRSLWSETYQRPELSRIFCSEVDALAKPASIAEEEFLNVVFIHYEMGWRLAKSADRSDLKPLAIDARHFFALPLPRAVWEKTRQFRNPKFVRFVERALI